MQTLRWVCDYTMRGTIRNEDLWRKVGRPGLGEEEIGPSEVIRRVRL